MNRSFIDLFHKYANNSDVYIHDCCTVALAHWRYEPPLPQYIHTAFALIGTLLFVLSVAGNISVMFLFQRFRSLRSFSNLFVLNLTIADFVLAVGNIPALVTASLYGRWVFGDSGCIIYAFIGSTASFVSINTLTAIAIDRCLVILKTLPVTNRMSRKAFFISVSCIWIYSILWACAPFYGFGNYVLEGTNTSCTFDFLTQSSNIQAHVASIFVAHFIIPLVIIFCSYSYIFRAISKHAHEFNIARTTYGENEVPLTVRKLNTGVAYEAKTARASLIVILVFCISWMPYAIIALIGVFGDATLVTRLSAGIPCLIAKFSTVVNPLIYALLHPKFRKKLVNLGACVETEQERRSTVRRSVIYFRARIPSNTSAV